MREPIRDIDFLVNYLRDTGEIESNPILADAADALEREHEKHLGECVQIGRYDDEIRGMKHD